MRGTYCYLPILPARKGAFRAMDVLSPPARSRLTPLFDVPSPVLKGNETIEVYLAERAQGIHRACGTMRPMYVDVHDLPLDLHTSSDTQPIVHLFDLLRMHSSLAVPVTGTEADRDKDYLESVRSIVARDRRGVCLRLTEDDLAERQTLGAATAAVLDFLAIGPSELDVILDFGHVGNRNPDTLGGTAYEALRAIHRIGRFRNIVVAGGSVPGNLGKRDLGKIRRESRIEFALWTQLASMLPDQMPIAFGDYGVIGAHYVPPGKAVNVPPRIRYTTLLDHVFYRAARGEYPLICRQLVASSDFADMNFSAGDRRIYRCANGLVNPGAPVDWVANDTNHHLELVSEQAWRFLHEANLIDRFVLPEPQHFPWLQVELV